MSTPDNVAPKLPKGHFKCFHCRKLFQMKDGDWHVWESMQVHLCKGCEKTTKARPERRAR